MRKILALIGLLCTIGYLAYRALRSPVKLQRQTGLVLRGVFKGALKTGEFGHAVAPLADLNQDGFDDFAIGASEEGPGRAVVILGQKNETRFDWRAEGGDQDLGCSVASAGDIDGDGVGDVIVGAERWPEKTRGEARVYSGKTGEVLHVLRGAADWDLFGHAVAQVGDIDQDGRPELIVGAPGTYQKNAAGYAQLISGKDGRVLRTFTGEGFKGDRFGYAVAAAGDIDRDGVPDVLVGALGEPAENKHQGRIYVFSGKDGRVLRTLSGDAKGDELGHGLAGGMDVNKDGYPDIFAGTFVQKGKGYARLYSGKDGAVLLHLPAEQTADAFGHSVDAGGDVDGDGVIDLVVGAPNADIKGATRAGYIKVYSGKDGRTLLRYEGFQERMHLGYAVSFAGDLNGDHLDDVLAGSVFIDEPGEVHAVSACAVSPIKTEAQLRLRRTEDGFQVQGPPLAKGALVVEKAGRAVLQRDFSLDETGRSAVRLSMIQPALVGQDLVLSVKTGSISSSKVGVRFCP